MNSQSPENEVSLDTQTVNPNTWIKNTQEELICFTICKHKGSSKTRGTLMISCVLCAHSFHAECVEMTEKPNVWTCHPCRTMPMMVQTLCQKLDDVIQQNTKLNEIVMHNQRLLDDLLRHQNTTAEVMTTVTKDLESLKTVKNEIKQTFASVKKIVGPLEIDDDDCESDDEDEDEAEPKGTLLIGDSLVRCLQSTADDLQITCLSGAKLNDIKKKLKKVNPKKLKYTDIFIVGGTNDTTTKKTANKIAQEFETLLQEAKGKAVNVHISSITPRTDTKADPNKIDNINQLLSTVANSLDVNYINNDNNFKYQDGTTDETLLLSGDKLHLSAAGASKLLQNMKLQEKVKVSFGNGPVSRWQQNATEVDTKASTTNHTNQWDKPLQVPAPAPMVPLSIPKATTSVNDNYMHDQSNTQPIKFRGARSSFSNFHVAPLKKWGMLFSSNEHAYNYRKAIEMGQHKTAEEIRYAASPRQAQLKGQAVVTDERWKNIKQSVMFDLLQDKARQCSKFREDLEASRGRSLIEDTSHEYWGRGNEGSGLNMLGRLLMTLRENLPAPARDLTMAPNRSRSYHDRRPYQHRWHDGQPRCFNCGERSHNVRTCRHSSPVQCHSCSKFGHKKKFCSTQVH